MGKKSKKKAGPLNLYWTAVEGEGNWFVAAKSDRSAERFVRWEQLIGLDRPVEAERFMRIELAREASEDARWVGVDELESAGFLVVFAAGARGGHTEAKLGAKAYKATHMDARSLSGILEKARRSWSKPRKRLCPA